MSDSARPATNHASPRSDGPRSSSDRVLDEILFVLDVQAFREGQFIGKNVHQHHVFGGQVFGQAIAAGGRTVPEQRRLHSAHAYFLAPGDWQKDILLDVETLRDGKSFNVRRITASQAKGPILVMTASWHVDEPGFAHATTAPVVSPPDKLVSDRKRFADLARTRPEVAQFAFRFEAFDSRQVEPVLMHQPGVLLEPRAPLKHTWVRTQRKLSDDPRIHEAMLGYISDLDFMSTTMLPHGAHPGDHHRIQGTSLDHSLWLHRPLRVDDWLLFAKESPTSAGARGFVRGQFFDAAGVMVASAAQECLIRPRVPLSDA